MRDRQLEATATPMPPISTAGSTRTTTPITRLSSGPGAVRAAYAPPANASRVGSQTGSRSAGGPASASALFSTPGRILAAGSKPVFS